MVTTQPAPSRRRSPTRVRVGLVLAAVLATADIATWAPQFADGPMLAAVGVAFGVATLVAVPFAWRGSTPAAVVAVVTRVVASLGGLPAFFVPGVPAVWVLLSASGSPCPVLAAALVVGGGRTS